MQSWHLPEVFSVMMTNVSLGQSDIPGPEGPAVVARIPGEGGERIGGGEEDRRAAQQPGEEEEEGIIFIIFIMWPDWASFLLLFQQIRWKNWVSNISTKDFYFERKRQFPVWADEPPSPWQQEHPISSHLLHLSLVAEWSAWFDSAHRAQGGWILIFCWVGASTFLDMFL